MPPNADSRRGSHLREHLLFLLLLLTLNVFAPPALAQNAPPAPADKSEQQKAAYAALADLLQDDKARAALINHLKQAAGDAPRRRPNNAGGINAGHAERQPELAGAGGHRHL